MQIMASIDNHAAESSDDESVGKMITIPENFTTFSVKSVMNEVICQMLDYILSHQNVEHRISNVFAPINKDPKARLPFTINQSALNTFASIINLYMQKEDPSKKSDDIMQELFKFIVEKNKIPISNDYTLGSAICKEFPGSSQAKLEPLVKLLSIVMYRISRVIATIGSDEIEPTTEQSKRLEEARAKRLAKRLESGKSPVVRKTAVPSGNKYSKVPINEQLVISIFSNLINESFEEQSKILLDVTTIIVGVTEDGYQKAINDLKVKRAAERAAKKKAKEAEVSVGKPEEADAKVPAVVA